MGAQKRWYDGHEMLFRKLPNGLEHLDLRVGIKAVTRFDLDRRRSVLHHRVEASMSDLLQLFLCRTPRGPHGAENASTLCGNILVALSFGSQSEFILPAAGKEEVRMSIDESGKRYER